MAIFLVDLPMKQMVIFHSEMWLRLPEGIDVDGLWWFSTEKKKRKISHIFSIDIHVLNNQKVPA